MGCLALVAGAFLGSTLGAAVGGGLCPERESGSTGILEGIECVEYEFFGATVGLVVGVVVALGLAIRMKDAPRWSSSYRSPLQRSEADVHGGAGEPSEVDPVADDEVESPR